MDYKELLVEIPEENCNCINCNSFSHDKWDEFAKEFTKHFSLEELDSGRIHNINLFIRILNYLDTTDLNPLQKYSFVYRLGLVKGMDKAKRFSSNSSPDPTIN